MATLTPSKQRMAIRLRAMFEFLRDSGGTASSQDCTDFASAALPLTEEELQSYSGDPDEWEFRAGFASIGAAKAGWIVKDGHGMWSITDAGRRALEDYPTPEEFKLASDAKYREWKSAQEETPHKAWIVRGASSTGHDPVPSWLEDGYCSIDASDLRPLPTGVIRRDVKAAATEDYDDLSKSAKRAKVNEILAFLFKMAPDDVVVTTDGSRVYVGDVTGGWRQVASDDGSAALRRDVEWRNADAPIAFGELADPLPARLQANGNVIDITADSDLVESSLAASAEIEGGGAGSSRAPRHEHLPQPSAGLAADLLVDADWLTEVRDLLDERRQVIFYGPPGTGKTWIARKLAADLVGPEQVKLVQFHPAYTYEDFFEGYRPAGGDTDGTISFELKAGPLRQLVNRAREHPDQAFVLIIDEINRANLAKVFGELYFLLEYRDQAVDLLYGDDEQGFTLPKNLYVIGTMNTADRSIALVDQAMRRRFAFVALNPDEEPTRSLLARWSARRGLDDTAARLLERLNTAIEDPDFRIGPSYFMTSTAPDAFSRQRLDRIWRTSIEPLLQEHHYGQWDAVRGDYDLDRLLGGE